MTEPDATPTPAVAVVVVAWNAAALLPACLAALPAWVRLVVVDNCSADDSAAVARRLRPDAVVLRTPRNLGFAGGVAEGLAHVGDADAVLLVNPDARLADGAVEALLAFLERHASAGLVSALVVDEEGVPERFAGGRALSLASLAVHELGLSRLLPGRSTYQPGPVERPEQRDWVAGTVVMARRAALEQVGGPDPSFFLYAEDRDWCRRLREAGWQVWVEPAARATHARSASVNAAGSWIDEHRVGALDAYWRRQHGRRGLVAFRLVRFAGSGLRALTLSLLALRAGEPQRRARAAQRRRDAVLRLRLLLGGGPSSPAPPGAAPGDGS